jgi:hypothetical protein
MLIDPEIKIDRALLRSYLAVIGLEAEAVVLFKPPQLGEMISTQLRLGNIPEALELARLAYAENP